MNPSIHEETNPQQDGRGGRDSVNGTRVRQEALMNHSFYSADRMTHLKIVVVALFAATVVAGVGILSRPGIDDNFQTARVIKAGKPVAITSSSNAIVR